MIYRLNSLFVTCAFASFCFCTTGCNPTDLSNVELPIPAESDSTDEPGHSTHIVSVANPDDSVSPAMKKNELPAADARPELVCQKFLDQLNQENADYFELLLTTAALNVSHRLEFHLPPIAEADAKFELSEPKFSTIREKICYIDCRFLDNSELASADSSMTWMLRKTRVGWRVAGMQVPGKDAKTTNLLSFENAVDVMQIKNSLAEPVEIATTSN